MLSDLNRSATREKVASSALALVKSISIRWLIASFLMLATLATAANIPAASPALSPELLGRVQAAESSVTGTVPQLDAPQIAIAPETVEITLYAGQTTTEQLTISNSGLLDLEISAVLEIPATATAPTQRTRPGITWVDDPFAVDAELGRSLERENNADFFIWLRERADLAPAYQIAGKEARHQFVYDALLGTAARSQAQIISYLERRQLDYQVFWINNSILVRGGDQALIDAMGARGDVLRIRALTTQMHIPDPEQLAIVARDEQDLNADPTWNIEIVNAPQVWSQLGISGDGVVVANIDTGVNYMHEALTDSYRGNLGSGLYDHNYNWGSIYGNGPFACAGSPAAPCDWAGHGSHTMGTMIGGDGEGPFDMDIGMAPDARWIACMGCDTPPNECSDAALTGCAQWVVAPLDLNGLNPDPTLAPDIVNNSWGGEGEDDWYFSFIEAWNAANIIPVFSAGNYGPDCNTLGSPGSYDNVISVGGTDSLDRNYTSTSRGPGSGTGIFPVQKPDIAAPGEGVYSSVAVGDNYATYSGTSMAAPHVAGLTALLRSVDPDIDLPSVWNLITGNAVTDLSIKNGSYCGNGPDFPNYVFGYGRIDAFATVQEVLLNSLDIPWVSLDPLTLTVEPANSQFIDLTFDSSGLEPGVYTGTLKVLHNDPLTDPILIPLKMTVAGTELMLMPPSDTMAGNPGDTVTYTLALTNNEEADTFDIAYSANVWDVNLSPVQATIDSGASAKVIVLVIIPSDAPVGASDTVLVTATSQLHPSRSASSDLTTTAVARYRHIYLPFVTNGP